ncbi:LAME_0D05732g1_1 [Lachancea meyersii CBS 8951]|uniref:Fatty acid synthase subunit alpha n=1 Tax=Lachancea meyersii CBS 8951 TaxID=1266667 RepID=A0A1G4J8N6_9SACH|nr:LAME_0D05732g1_1 [Lachancea meyersii CBS 8951]
MKPETENELCHILLTELLAYQFAWPVRWIETQDVLLNQFQAERLIEIGPQPILANMAKRTLGQAANYENATSIAARRQVLSVATSMDEITYRYDPPVKDEATGGAGALEEPARTKIDVCAMVESVNIDVNQPAQQAAQTSLQQFADAPGITPDLALRFLISRKMNNFDIQSLPVDKSIKEICNGKSTLQNEIVGDLGKEFPELQSAHQIEEMPINSISKEAALSCEPPNEFGPLTVDAVSKFMPRKFAGDLCSLSNVKQYLKTTWNVQTSSGILLFMASADLKERLSTEEETKRFIDESCAAYAKMCNVNLTVRSSKASGPDGGIPAEDSEAEKIKVVDIENYLAFESDLLQLHNQQHQILTQHLKTSDGKSEIDMLKAKLAKMEGKLSAIEEEFGADLINNSLQQSFSPLKIRNFDSAWNWARQSILMLLQAAHREPQRLAQILNPTIVQNIANRADASVIRIIQYSLNNNDYDPVVKRTFEKVISFCLQEISKSPLYRVKNFDSTQSRLLCHSQNSTQYIKEISLATAASTTEPSSFSTRLNSDMSSYYKIEKQLFQVYSKIIQYSLTSNNSPSSIRSQFETVYEQLLIFLRNSDHVASFFRGIVNEAVRSVNKTLITTKDDDLDVVINDSEILSSDDEDEDPKHAEKNQVAPNVKIPTGIVPFLHLKKRSNVSGEWNYDKQLTQTYLNNLARIAQNGISFFNKRTLIFATDAKDKIALEVIRALLQAGSIVVIASERFDRETCEIFQKCYQNYGATGSELTVLPLNMSSRIDVSRFSAHLFSKVGDIDFFLPLHVRTTPGSILDYTSGAELAHRSSSVNLLRFLGSIVREKRLLGIETRPTHVLLPLSPNHANVYEKSNFRDTFMALVLQKWYDEDWSAELSICGCVYGWTHDDDGDVIAQGLERMGIRTFANKEMAFNMLGLLTYDVVFNSQDSPLIADLNGGLQTLPNLSSLVAKLKHDFQSREKIEEAVSNQHLSDKKLLGYSSVQYTEVKPRGTGHLQFPALLPYNELSDKFHGENLAGLLDLSSVVVVTGFGELGPWGSARTRWEIEKNETFSLEGCIEMAAIMGMIEYSKIDDGKGWVDCETREPVEEFEIKEKYESRIQEHCGIRFVEPELFQGYDPHKKQFLHEIVLTHDLSPVTMSLEQAEQYKLLHEDKVEIYPANNESECRIKFLKGCCLMIPKAIKSDRFVAGQIPTGWDPASFGIPDDIVSQVDPVTLYALVATAEALITSGIKDPYEFYKYVHVSEVGNCSGSGLGGMKSHREMQKNRFKDQDVQSDILPETFANVTAAWINMLLLSSSGPIKTPVGACATAVESLENAVETILSKKARICIAGGCDDFEEHIAHEFGNMGATSNSAMELERGREPSEMCRPATSTRNGFMESQGAGMQILMSADLAIEMGVPIYGVVAMASTASDKIGKSLPAPGQGILTCARQTNAKPTRESPKLSAKYRQHQLSQRLTEIKQWAETEIAEGMDADFVDQLAKTQREEAKKHWGNTFWHNDSSISPIKGCLATFGLTIDDLAVASCHGTSTKANEKNESQILNTMMTHLGRTEGNPVLTVFQKYLTGHPKGAAGAWMANGVLQYMQDGLVPGNRNADNIDKEFAQHDHLIYPSENLNVGTIRAACLTSFGFGQKGSMAVMVNPNFALAALSGQQYQEYTTKVTKRAREAQRHFSDALINHTICSIKSRSPFSDKDEENVYLDPSSRADDTLKISIT